MILHHSNHKPTAKQCTTYRHWKGPWRINTKKAINSNLVYKASLYGPGNHLIQRQTSPPTELISGETRERTTLGEQRIEENERRRGVDKNNNNYICT